MALMPKLKSFSPFTFHLSDTQIFFQRQQQLAVVSDFRLEPSLQLLLPRHSEIAKFGSQKWVLKLDFSFIVRLFVNSQQKSKNLVDNVSGNWEP